jgi:diacylglycerol kinase family enzyme
MSSAGAAVLFVNPKSGGGKAARASLPEQARERGIDAIVLGPGDDLSEVAHAAVERGAGTLGVAGGDGSLAIVAAVALEHGFPFVCVPAGTRNHFALDLGLDRHDVVGALDAFTAGIERRIDVGEVNGRVFLNNVSLGIYGDAVQEPGYRDAKGRTLLETALRVLGPSGDAGDIELEDDRGSTHRSPGVALVSNNPYALEPPHALGTRPRLDGAELGVIVLDKPSAGPAPARTWTASQLEIRADSPVHAGIDGEAVELSPPLRFAVRPGALRVRVPRP